MSVKKVGGWHRCALWEFNKHAEKKTSLKKINPTCVDQVIICLWPHTEMLRYANSVKTGGGGGELTFHAIIKFTLGSRINYFIITEEN